VDSVCAYRVEICRLICSVIYPSGNHTPGSRPHSDSVCAHLSLKFCSKAARIILRGYISLWLVSINARDEMTMLFDLSKQWQPEGKQNYYSTHNFTTRVSFNT